MSFIVIIPARFNSSRLPGKVLLDIAGKPMLQWVWERACASGAERVIIAADDVRIAAAVAAFGGEVCMTRGDHESGTDRLQEVVERFNFDDRQIVVNVQGDEPLIPPSVIDQVALNLAGSERAGIATLAKRIRNVEEVFNPNVVKVVVDNTQHALYFSRAPIPWDRENFQRAYLDGSNSQSNDPNNKSNGQNNKANTVIGCDNGIELCGDWARHIGIYAYRVEFLHRFVTWPTGRLEQLEKLEQLRAMENGVAIHVDESNALIPPGVDTAEDLERVRAVLNNDSNGGDA